ncbi:MAG: hypothetical protein ABIG61_12140 [Planctomycetota bacterium]
MWTGRMKIIIRIQIWAVLIGTGFAASCTTSQPQTSPQVNAPAQTVDAILEELENAANALKSYQACVESYFIEPLLESKTLRIGMLYYQKQPGGSKLRINFHTLVQDDEEPEKHIEQIIFDGVWLTRIDYQTQTVRYEQIADENHPVDAFEFASRHIPIIGFSRPADLKNQFEIALVDINDPNLDTAKHLLLKPKPDSKYESEYLVIDFWTDPDTALPTKIVATTADSDTYEIKLLRPEINKKLPNAVFRVEKPNNFDENRIPLSDRQNR